MRIRLSLFLWVVQIPLWCAAQDGAAYTNLHENIHLHLNKTTFIKGERLWFTAYVHDQLSKRPSVPTQNLHVAIYDQEGTKLKRKVFYTENGIAIGDFAIDSTFVDEEYLVVGYTNYMQNFEQLEPFRQRIKVVQDAGTKTSIGDTGLELTVYPEGGNLIGGTFNNFAILLRDIQNGSGMTQNELRLIDGNGKVVRSNVSTNKNGFGKVSFNYEEGNTYFLELETKQGERVKEQLPDPTAGELGLHIENMAGEQTLFKMVGSEAVFEQKEGDAYGLAVYQDDNLFYEDIEINRDEPVISLDRDRVPYGVNTAVLLNENLVPVAHRMFFNHGKLNNRVEHLEISHCKIGDSIQIDLLLPDSNESAVLSASVMPFGTRAYNPDNSIVSSFLLRPYINGNTQELHSYFTNMDRQKRYALDLLLMIEGWGKYDWDSRTQQEAQLEYAFESGFEVKGRVLDANLEEEQQVTFITDRSKAIAYAELDREKSFKINLELLGGDSVGISLIGRKGKLRRPIIELMPYNVLSKSKYGYEASWGSLDKFDLPEELIQNAPNTIMLEEVTLIENRLTKRVLTSPNIETDFIDDNQIKRIRTVGSYIRRLGYNLMFLRGKMIAFSPRMGGRGYPVVTVTVNGALSSVDAVWNMPLSSVESISVGRHALGFSSAESNFIAIQSKEYFYVRPENRENFVKFLINEGYTSPQIYTNPGYTDYNSNLFIRYGALDWKNRIPVSSDVPTSIRIPDFGLDQVEIFIEGMGHKGSLISQQKTITME